MTREDIAIIGLACMFPSAPDVNAFWRNILGGVDAISDPPEDGWNTALWYDPASGENDRAYCKRGGYLAPIAYFNPLEHGVMPRAAESGDPDQWLALKVAREALTDAGYPDGAPGRERAAVILGKGNYICRGNSSMTQHAHVIDQTLRLLRELQPELTDDSVRALRRDLKQSLPRFDSEAASALVPNIVAGRIANRLDLMGPSYTVDAACASSLVSIDIAVRGLREGEYDLALAGGVHVTTPYTLVSLFCQLGALSHAEQIRPFDKNADGTLMSEGVGMVVLKRRADAERDGDRIYAVIKGVGVASDGKALSVLAPRVDGEELALRRAYQGAGVPPETIGLIEAHGTGTLVGDAVEVDALARVFGTRGAREPRCALGTVKSMIGHTLPAAGVAGLIKVVLALYHRVLPPTLHVEEPSPRLHLERTPFYVSTETRPWIHGSDESPRRAGVNAFGFGGINAHLIAEEYRRPDDAGAEPIPVEWDAEVCVLQAGSRAALAHDARALRERLASDSGRTLASVAREWNCERASLATAAPATLAIVAASVVDLDRKLEKAIPSLEAFACARIKDVSGIYFFEEPLARRGKVAFLFPGEGAQYVNMLADLCLRFPRVRACFDQMDRVMAGHSRGYLLSQSLFPPPAFSDAERETAQRRLWQMDLAIEAVLAGNLAICTLLEDLGIRPEAILGHSTGEYSAMRAAGILDEARYEQHLRGLNELYRSAEDTIPDEVTLLAIGAPRAQIDSVVDEVGGAVYVAMDNCPHQVVLAGPREAAERAAAVLRERGLLYEALRFDRAYHTPLFGPFADALREFQDAWIASPPRVPLYSCTVADRFPDDLGEIRRVALDHWLQPVLFRQTIERMYADGVRIFVEAGPRGNLCAFVDDILRGLDAVAIPANVMRRSGVMQLNHLVAQLAAHGVPMNLQPLYERRTEARPHSQTVGSEKRDAARIKLATGFPEMTASSETLAAIRQSLRAQPARPVPDTAPMAAAPEPEIPALAAVEPAPAVETAHARRFAEPPAVPHGAPAGAEQVMAAYLQTMEGFLALQRNLLAATLTSDSNGAPGDRTVVASFAQPALPATVSPAVATLPFIQSIVGEQPGEWLVGRCDVTLERYPFLRDHTFGREVSTASDLLGWSIMPLTLSMEMLAEGAAALVPGLCVVGMKDIRAHRWIALERPCVPLQIIARRSGPGQVSVEIREAEAPEAGAPALPMVEGVVLLADRYPEPPPTSPFALSDEGPSRWGPERLYEDVMFHGPSLQGVASMDRLGREGAEATLKVLPYDGLFADTAARVVTDGVLLDQVGQVVGFWAEQVPEKPCLVPPFRLDTLRLFGPPLPAGELVTCRASTSFIPDRQVRSTLEVVDARGRVWARLEGWQNRRFELPHTFYRLLLSTKGIFLSRRWSVPMARPVDAEGAVACRIGVEDFLDGWFTTHGGFWRRVFVYLVLGDRERALWHALKTPEPRRVEWLLGRIAAKDAVRHYVRQRHGLELCPADVEILPDANGRPIVAGAWTGRVPAVPIVSVSHSEGTAVAIATGPEAASGVGVDLERVGRVKAGMETVAFTAEERTLLASFVAPDGEWPVRLWCAKEAAAKAIGEGLVRGPQAFVVNGIDRGSGQVQIGLPDGTAGAGAPLTVATAREGDLVIATCVQVGGSVAA